jgi:transcriptional regulator with XRE-family HTH domain
MSTDAFSAADLGAAFRAERLALRRTLQWVADHVGCRRQTIADLEAGKNVGLYTVFAALAALDKGLAIVDSRKELDRLKALLDED